MRPGLPDTVILGHYYYGNLLFCCDEYLTRRAPALPLTTLGRRGRDGSPSWLDYFILGDVYSLGFGFDTSEMDLWWLLCRKKRERADHGELYFFEPERKSASRKKPSWKPTSQSCVTLGVSEPEGKDYRNFYEMAVREIGRRVQA